ncbi:ATP-binding cassette domain-containing protein [Prolixibacteraceae bacterium Z1-6]|uniref:ATP-binding cassette domain-containing protein n=1 Tax=Draconibacterium aestuarii TaxID=2998507 RepID=A0A9X3F3N2_9BACT|nr:ATP-binding cassette domain-containing protein [Prolixibacteraceae bacterium Z1-6]
MIQDKHWAIFGPGISMKSAFMQDLQKGVVPDLLNHFSEKRGVLFSTYTLQKFIKEEVQHDDYTLSEAEHRSIRTFSSGEQRKALLNYLISLHPDFIVFDNIFDMLDVESREILTRRLSDLSQKTPIIQVVKRKDNLLPFIKNAIRIENEKISYSGTIEQYEQLFITENSIKLKEQLPPPLEHITLEQNPLIQFTHVTVSYADRTIVKNINWEIKNGDFWQLKGPNGSGKTTLLTMITGDNPKAYGQDIVLFGHKRGTGESIWDIKKKIGYVTPSLTTLFRGWNTVEKMVISGLVDSIGLYKKPTELQKQVAGQWIKLIGLAALKHQRFATLSEVQQCMVLIARAMIKHPPLLILDEPAHGLDDTSASLLTSLINKISDEGQTTIIYVSHRKEPGLKPRQVFELIPGDSGSQGRIQKK